MRDSDDDERGPEDLQLQDFEEALAAVREDIQVALEQGDFARAAALIDDMAADLGEDDPEVRFERAALAWEQQGPEAAIELLDALLRDCPDHADAHYARGFACEELDDYEGMVLHFLEVLRLDAEHDAQHGLGSEEELDFIEATAEEVLDSVPEQFRQLLADVPVVLEPRPHPDIVREGFDPRSLGLFEGVDHGHRGGDHTRPTRIVLFHANLLAEFPDREVLAEEIEITLLHEIGHFFGLDEDDVERLGLQ